MLVGGTLTQLVASLGTPFAFDPPAGCVLFLDEVAERPYRLDRMLTQLRLSGMLGACRGHCLQRAAAVRRAGRQPDAPGTSSGGCWRISRPDTVRPAVRPHGRRRADAAVRCRAPGAGRRPPVAGHRRGGSRVNGRSDAPTDMTRIHLIGICGTAMATLAALLKSRGYDVRGSDQNVYPPMSDFLRNAGHHDAPGLRRRAHHRRHRPGGGRQCDLARQRRARGSARSEDSLLLAARGGPRSFPLGRTVDRHRRHARKDHDDVADRLAAGARRRRPERVHRRHRRELREQLSHRRRPRVRDRRRRVRQRLLRQDRQVPEVPAGHRRRQQHRVRSRGHLSGPRGDPAGLSAVRQPDSAARPAAPRRRQRRGAGARASARSAGSRRSA